MKTVENKKVNMTDPKSGQEFPSSYGELIENCCLFVPKEGVSPLDNMNRIRILDVVKDKEKEAYEFEDADFKYLLLLEKNVRWGVVSRAADEFHEYIISIK